MIPRRVRDLVDRRLARYPAVSLVGARQAGKTTLARMIGGLYFDLEQEPERLRLDLDWDKLVEGRDLVILDEAQTWPAVFPRLRGAIDGDRKRNGRFLLLGSVSPALMTMVSESLAGRLSLVELTPLLIGELGGRTNLRSLWLCGGFPDGGVLDREAFPQWQRDYLRLLTQRDLPAWGLPAAPQVTDRLVKMLAAVHGQTWNASQIGKSLGLSYHTVNSYVDALEGAFLVRRLPSLQANTGKRLVKSPKVYLRDSGLVHASLGATDERALLAEPWVGASWEGFVVEQIVGAVAAAGAAFEASFFRTSDGREVDLVLDLAGERWAVEVKLTASPGPHDLARLDSAADLIGATRRVLVSQTPESTGAGDRASCDLPGALALLGV